MAIYAMILASSSFLAAHLFCPIVYKTTKSSEVFEMGNALFKKNDTKPLSNKTELCVYCGTSTKYKNDEPISSRVGYIQGAGQLCLKCYKDLYPKGDDSND